MPLWSPSSRPQPIEYYACLKIVARGTTAYSKSWCPFRPPFYLREVGGAQDERGPWGKGKDCTPDGGRRSKDQRLRCHLPNPRGWINLSHLSKACARAGLPPDAGCSRATVRNARSRRTTASSPPRAKKLFGISLCHSDDGSSTRLQLAAQTSPRTRGHYACHVPSTTFYVIRESSELGGKDKALVVHYDPKGCKGYNMKEGLACINDTIITRSANLKRLYLAPLHTVLMLMRYNLQYAFCARAPSLPYPRVLLCFRCTIIAHDIPAQTCRRHTHEVLIPPSRHPHPPPSSPIPIPAAMLLITHDQHISQILPSSLRVLTFACARAPSTSRNTTAARSAAPRSKKSTFARPSAPPPPSLANASSTAYAF
eukprot:scaffold8580_cov102-Isochrysis_galbana.AAC.5